MSYRTLINSRAVRLAAKERQPRQGKPRHARPSVVHADDRQPHEHHCTVCHEDFYCWCDHENEHGICADCQAEEATEGAQ